MKELRFEWDERKNKANARKHGIGFDEARTAFYDENAVLFFDPDLSERAPGTYAILCQIEEARRQGLEHLYLGYWIGECRKMSYKESFRPVEGWTGEIWRRYDRGAEIG